MKGDVYKTIRGTQYFLESGGTGSRIKLRSNPPFLCLCKRGLRENRERPETTSLSHFLERLGKVSRRLYVSVDNWYFVRSCHLVRDPTLRDSQSLGLWTRRVEEMGLLRLSSLQ